MPVVFVVLMRKKETAEFNSHGNKLVLKKTTQKKKKTAKWIGPGKEKALERGEGI